SLQLSFGPSRARANQSWEVSPRPAHVPPGHPPSEWHRGQGRQGRHQRCRLRATPLRLPHRGGGRPEEKPTPPRRHSTSPSFCAWGGGIGHTGHTGQGLPCLLPAGQSRSRAPVAVGKARGRLRGQTPSQGAGLRGSRALPQKTRVTHGAVSPRPREHAVPRLLGAPLSGRGRHVAKQIRGGRARPPSQRRLRAGRTPGEARTPPDERMLCVALGVVALLGLAGGCAAPHNAVSRMLHLLEGSAGTTEPPNPSVLLALNLAGAGANSRCKLLLQQLQETAVERAPKDMTSGELALYTLALLSSCQSPRRVQALGHTVDLLRRLQERTDEEVAYLVLEGAPRTTFYQLSLDVLALCLEGTGSYEVAAVMLAKEVLSPGSGLSVGERLP
uniref:Uncharacterized protein n=1 Tax=Apteryx owenii TaxID=8824 RepID=A0A8B9Q013_APTOW